MPLCQTGVLHKNHTSIYTKCTTKPMQNRTWLCIFCCQNKQMGYLAVLVLGGFFREKIKFDSDRHQITLPKYQKLA